MHYGYILLSFLVFIIGVIVYGYTDKPAPKEVARCMMWCGLFVTLYAMMYYKVPLL